MEQQRCESIGDVRLLAEQIQTISDVLDQRDPMEPTERIEAWHAVHLAHEALSVVVGQMNADAVDAMRQLGDTQRETGFGVVHVSHVAGTQHWRGYELLGALSTQLVDREAGELVDAVPVDVLRQVIAGCRQPDQTSSRWVNEGLEGVLTGGRWRQYRRIGEGYDKMKPGAAR